MKRILFCLTIVVTLLVSSCSIKQHVHFKNDWSGSLSYDIDMGSLQDMMGGDSTAGAGIGSVLGDSGEFTTAMEALKVSPGLTNIVVEEDTVKGTFHIAFDFADLATLNDVMSGSGLGSLSTSTNENSDHTYFLLKKNKLTYKMPPMDQTSDEEMGQMDGMMSMITFELNISFDKKVKKIKSKTNAVISSTNKEVIWKPDFEKLSKGEAGNEIQIILEK
ncbi:MAG: hypothetical protein ACI9J3_002429 [Parvicellaceae bacterium]|jgi:hypothetical protein